MTAKAREELEVKELDRRLANLRLVSPAELGRMRSSIERMGLLSPVLVSTAVESTRAVLVDGFKRVRVLTDLGLGVVWVTRAALDATAAKIALVAANAPHQGLCDLEEAWVVRALCREHKLTQAQVGQALRRDKSWVCRRLSLAERLGAEIQDEMRLGLLSSTVARALARLPRGNQERAAKAVRAHELTSRQTHLLVLALLAADDPGAREEMLADPLRYLGQVRVETPGSADPRLGPGGNELRRGLLALVGMAARTWRSLERHAPVGLGGDEARVLTPLATEALRVSRETAVRLERLLADSGTGA